MESFEKDGIWFLPETPDREVFGRLVFSKNQIPTLKLAGELRDFDIKEKLEEDIRYQIIHGYLIGNKGESDTYKVTLQSCYQKKGFRTGIQTSEIHAEYVLQGYHFSSLEENKFQGLIVQYTHLEKWVNLSKVSIKSVPNEEQTGTIREIINIKQEVNELIDIGRLKDCSITIRDKPWFNPQLLQLAKLHGWDSSEILLREQKEIFIKAKEPKDLEYFLDVIYLLQEFLTFACGQIILPCKVTTYIIGKAKEIEFEPIQFFHDFNRLKNQDIQNIHLEDIKREDIKISEQEKPFLIKIFYQLPLSSINKSSFDANKILFKFTDIQRNSAIVLDNWQKIQENLTSIIQLYLRLHYIPVRHVDDLFLSLAQAIEGFHRIHHQGKYCDDDTFEKIKQELEKIFSSELKKYDIEESSQESLLNKINYWNEYSLKERLEDLLNDNDFDNCLPEHFFSQPIDKQNFVRQVRDTRGSLTHPDSKNPKKNKKKKKNKKYIVSGVDLNKLISKLRIILEICFLKALGLNSLEIKKIISQKI